MLNPLRTDPILMPYLNDLTKSKKVAQISDTLQHPSPHSSFDEDERDALSTFQPHGLTDLKDANLMNRVDTKFLIPRKHLPKLLHSLTPYYSALEIDNKRLFTYHNTYFDTTNYNFYHQHHQGKLNRYKVRHRHYVDTGTSFLEVKFKNNKGRTIKSRIACELNDVENPASNNFLKAKLGENFEPLLSSQWGSYNRIALANECEKERLTLDLNLHFSASRENQKIDLEHFFIAELKQSKYNLRSAFYQQMCQWGIRPLKFSKYCIGCSLVLPELKQNRFKSQLLAVSNYH